jgi:dihydroneopterin aldolase
MITHPISMLTIKTVELNVKLGWSEQERQTAQTIWIDIDIYFATPPNACHTDELTDTICYADIILHLQQSLASPSFKLIEHLSWHIHQRIKSLLPPTARLMIHLTKRPDVPGYAGAVCFSYGDEK